MTYAAGGGSISDIVFAFPPAQNGNTFVHHLGVGYICSYVQQHDITTTQFVTSQKKTIPDIVTGILQYKPEVVGFTCYDMNYAYVRILTKMLKKRDSCLRVIVGGPTATFSTQEIMNHTPEIDLCVRGEGEQTVLELLQEGFTDLESIQGIAFRSNNELVFTPLRPLISGGEKEAELDILPSPYLTEFIPPEANAGILTSRGCVHHCTFCSFSIMFDHTIRYHSVDRVIAELTWIAEHWSPINKSQLIMINDDIFSLNLKRAKNLCQKIIDEGINLPLLLETRADNVDRELIELMRDAGVKLINFGLESASCKVLRAIKKVPPMKERQFLTQVKNSVQWAKEAGMTTSVSVIFGLPGEGPKEAEKTLNFVKKLNVDEYSHNLLAVHAGTELFHTRKKYDLGIHHSHFFLPYLTRYAYDVRQITPLSNSNLTRELDQWKKVCYNLLSYATGRNENGYEYLMIRKMPEDVEEFFNWLKMISVLPISIVDTTDNITEEKRSHYLNMLLHCGVPVGLYFIMAKKNQPQISTSELDKCISVSETPFHQHEKGADGLLSLEQPQDVEALAKFLDAHMQEGILSFSAKEVPKTLVGTCRWRESLCPALSGGILVINGKEVLSCYYGGCIGTVGNTIETLQKKMQKLLREKEAERGCQNCPVRKICSRCLFPPLPDNEFCSLKRKYPPISKLVTVIERLQRSSTMEDQHVLLRVEENAPPLFYQGTLSREGEPLPEACDSVRLLSYGGEAIAFSIDELRSFSLGSTMAAILEAFLLKVDAENLISYLCQNTGAERKKVLKSISYAIFLLKKMEFLKIEQMSG